MRRLPRIPLWVATAFAGAAVGAVVTALVATGGGTHGRLSLEQQRLQAAVHARIAQRREAMIVARRVAVLRESPAILKPHGHSRYHKAAAIAEQYLGVPYVWGGASPHGFDASGLVMYVYKQLGVSLAHYTVSQWNYRHAVHVSRRHLERGDLVFFDGLDHVGIYIGHHQFIHAPHTGAVVRIESLTGMWARRYYGAKRIVRRPAHSA